jgi:hypothetical protein
MANTFGSYNYDTYCLITDNPETMKVKRRRSDTAGRAGGYAGGGVRAPATMTVKGLLKGGGSIISRWRQFLTAHDAGDAQQLQFDYFGSRFRYAEVESVMEVGGTGYPSDRLWEVIFAMEDPFWYSTTLNSADTLSVGSATSLTNNGSASAAPSTTLVVSGYTAGCQVVVTHDGGQFILIPNGTGTYVIDSRTGGIAKGGAAFYGWDGVLPSILPGSTTMTVAVTGGATLSSATVQWRDRD